ncbi:hypothetical protein [Sulfuricystis multivorans]|uniref:hypothetical protein n=1 Tax=Sulfuricystis multivorans TaxID=2211108 RepID=UPI000F816284|nr:hypothetical protein [Sulfuricystis multivorans]
MVRDEKLRYHAPVRHYVGSRSMVYRLDAASVYRLDAAGGLYGRDEVFELSGTLASAAVPEVTIDWNTLPAEEG